MKSFLMAMIGLLIIVSSARAQKSKDIVPADYVYDENKVTPDTADNGLKYDAILIGGIGLASDWWNYYYYAPAINIGFELPFTRNHMAAMEINVHSWIDEIKKQISPIYPREKYFINIKDEYYSQIGISALFKFYILEKNSDFRIALFIGYMLGFLKEEYHGFDFGGAIYYRINESLTLSSDFRFITHGIPLFMNLVTTPKLLTINLNYNFKW